MNKHTMLNTGLLAVLLLMLSATLVSAQDEVTLRWRTRPDNQAEIDVYTAASASIDEEWDGVALAYEPGGSESSSYQDVLVTEIDGEPRLKVLDFGLCSLLDQPSTQAKKFTT